MLPVDERSQAQQQTELVPLVGALLEELEDLEEEAGQLDGRVLVLALRVTRLEDERVERLQAAGKLGEGPQSTKVEVEAPQAGLRDERHIVDGLEGLVLGVLEDRRVRLVESGLTVLVHPLDERLRRKPVCGGLQRRHLLRHREKYISVNLQAGKRAKQRTVRRQRDSEACCQDSGVRVHTWRADGVALCWGGAKLAPACRGGKEWRYGAQQSQLAYHGYRGSKIKREVVSEWAASLKGRGEEAAAGKML